MKPDPTKAIRKEFSRTNEARFIHRLHGVLLVLSGLSSGEAGRLLHVPQRTVAYWVKQYRESGIHALKEAKRSGRPGTVNARQRSTLRTILSRSPRDVGYGADTWTGGLLSKLLRKRYSIKLTMRHCRRLLNSIVSESNPSME